MNNLTTRKIVLGMLMALVLAFSVQGIAEALTFSTSRSGDLETKAPNETFTIRFSVSLKGNTAIRIAGDLVKDSTSNNGNSARIDSSGYLVTDGIGGSTYRNTTQSDVTDLGALVIGSRPRLNSDGSADTASGPYYVDSSKNVVNSNGDAVYVQTGDGTDASPWRYTRAKADPTEKIDDQFRYHYNEETIKVNLTGNARIIKVGSRDVNISADDDDLDMYERTHPSYDSAAEHQKLSGSVSLVLEPTGVAGDVVTVKVTDDTEDADAPTKPPPITFTLYSVKYQSGVTGNDNTTTLVGDGVESAFDNDVRPLGGTHAAPNCPLFYISGNGCASPLFN